MDRSNATNLRLRQVDRRAKVKGLGLDLIGTRKARAVKAVNRWGRGLGCLCDEPVDIGLVESSGHISVTVASALGVAPLLNHEFGEVNLVDYLGAEKAVELGNQLFAHGLASAGIVQCCRCLGRKNRNRRIAQRRFVFLHDITNLGIRARHFEVRAQIA